MSYRLYICFISFFLGIISNTLAQEQEFLDDSTQDVHGLHSTFFLRVDELKYNKIGFRPISIDIHRLDQFSLRQKAAYSIQDLGNQGTAAKHIFYTLPKHIGFHTGFYVYDMYFRDPLRQKYYDTKSTYTDGKVTFANYGSYLFKVCHARSFSKNWHVGAIFESMLTDKEFIPTKIPYDREVITYPFTLFGHYKSNNGIYWALGSFYRKNHRHRETGGISCEEKHVPMDAWLDAKINISNHVSSNDSVESGELRQQYYLYHQLTYTEPLQIYHELTLRNTFNYFKTGSLQEVSRKFLADSLLNTQNNLDDKTINQTLSNEVGIKGQANRVFYQYYYLQKQIDLQKTNLIPNHKLQEHYLGIYTRINLRKNIDLLYFKGEYLQGDFYKLHTVYEGSFFHIAYDNIKYRPSLLSVVYNRPYRKWHKFFKPATVKQVTGNLYLSLPNIVWRPYGKFTHIQSPVYFKKPTKYLHSHNTIIEPFQAAGDAQLITWGSKLDIAIWSYFHVDTDVSFNKSQGKASNVFRIPRWYTSVRTYYAKSFYEGKSDIETGIDFNWKSSYKADAYDPVTQQFFIQDIFLVYAYPILEVFFNFRISNFRAFIKVIHVNEGIPKKGYFVTPFYPGQHRSLDVGFSWSLFN